MASRPEDRYVQLTTKTLKNGQVVYTSAIPITPAVTDDDIRLVASETDRMDIIANNVYGAPEEWWRIAAANRLVKGSLHFKPNTTIIIPKV